MSAIKIEVILENFDTDKKEQAQTIIANLGKDFLSLHKCEELHHFKKPTEKIGGLFTGKKDNELLYNGIIHTGGQRIDQTCRRKRERHVHCQSRYSAIFKSFSGLENGR